MKQSKCKICGKYEVRQKEVKSVKIFNDVETNSGNLTLVKYSIASE